MIDEENVFDQPVNDNIRAYENIQKITTDSKDDYRTDCLFNQRYFKEIYKLIAIDLSKQENVDSDKKDIQQTIFIGNLEIDRDTTIIFVIIEEVKLTILYFP